MNRRRLIVAGLLVLAMSAHAGLIGITGVRCFDCTAAGGGFDDGSSQVITGSGFGTKSTAAPALWNRMTGTIGSDYDVIVPNAAADGAYDIQYRAVGYRSVAGPHSRTTHYMVGGHDGSNTLFGGNNVMANKGKASRANGDYYYVRWYARLDPSWEFSGTAGDNNHKIWVTNWGGNGPYESPHEMYIDYNQDIWTSGSSTVQHKIGVDVLENPDSNAHSNYWDSGTDPRSAWVLYEVECKISTSIGGGYFKLWSDGVLKVDYLGKTDDGFGTSWSVGIGGYAGTYPISPTNNFRYFADQYIDFTAQRVVLANASTLAAATIREIQIPTAWADTSVSYTVNLGKFQTPGATAYVCVVGLTGAQVGSCQSITVGN